MLDGIQYKYKGKTPVKKGDKVELLALDEEGVESRYAEAKVIDPLAKQFTCRPLYTKHVRYYFYDDEGVTWRKA